MAATDFNHFYADVNIFFVSEASYLRIFIYVIEYACSWIRSVFISVYSGYYQFKQNGGLFPIWPPLVSASGVRDVFTPSHIFIQMMSEMEN